MMTAPRLLLACALLTACNVEDDPNDPVTSEVDVVVPDVPADTLGVPPPADPGDVKITVVWHVISSGSAANQGNVTDTQIANQIAKLNQDFVAPSFYFTLKGITRTVNSTWFTAGPNSAAEYDMRDTLHQGTAKTLNVYSKKTETSALLGWSSVPIDYFDDPSADGVSLLYSSLPGGSAAPYNLGNQLTSYVGRWLGLEWVWNGGCSSNGTSGGDFILDTPAAASEAWGCPTNRDSCPNLPGKDPIHNYMQFTDDSCRNNFTPKQLVRMNDQWEDFRDGN